MKKLRQHSIIYTTITLTLIIFTNMLFLCSCKNNDNEEISKYYDEIYSLYNCYKNDISVIMENVNPDNNENNQQETETKIEEANWTATILLKLMEEKPSNLENVEWDIEDIQEVITKISGCVDDVASYHYQKHNINSFNMSPVENAIDGVSTYPSYFIEINSDVRKYLKSLDDFVTPKLQSKNLINIKELKKQFPDNATNFITVEF